MYRVELEWDDCFDRELFKGSRDECMSYLRCYWHLNKGKQSLTLINCQSGRHESFVL